MEKFEYKIIKRSENVALGSGLKQEEKTLNEFGEKGWELIRIKFSKIKGIEDIFYFKRKK